MSALKVFKSLSKTILLLSLPFIIISCSNNEMTSEVTQPGELIDKKVDDESHDNEKFKATFSTLDTNHIPKNITFEVDKNVWNLLEKDKVYNLHYIYKHQSDKFVLKEISLSKVSLDDLRQKNKEIKGEVS
ncbi:hypothetical protein [Virgibacillus doumboii]|uniref:hypothetical protein n=1 Tax=Virgibacillus doumboii TaxID=2697503 RepID=UPI0013DFC166|nr:hypothetical protein [Virgibacillus doumboii]